MIILNIMIYRMLLRIVKPRDKMYCSLKCSMQYAMHFINTPCVYSYKRYDDYQFPCGITILCSKRWYKAICDTRITSFTSDGYFSNACWACNGSSYLLNRQENNSLCSFEVNMLCFFVTDFTSTTTTRHNSWRRHQMKTLSALLGICAGNSPVTGAFPHKGQWRGDLMFSVICTWINGWVNNREAGDLRRHRAYCDVIVTTSRIFTLS